MIGATRRWALLGTVATLTVLAGVVVFQQGDEPAATGIAEVQESEPPR